MASGVPRPHPQWRDLRFEEIIKPDGHLASLNIDSQNSLLSEKGSCSTEGIWKTARSKGGSLKNIVELTDACRKALVPCYWFRYERSRDDHTKYPATVLDSAQWNYWRSAYRDDTKISWDADYVDEIKALIEPGDIQMAYPGHGSVFASNNLQKHLTVGGIRTLLISGYHTDWCVEMAARDSRELGYVPIVVGDACGTASEEAHRSTLGRINDSFAPVVPTDFVVKLLRKQLAMAEDIQSYSMSSH
jgi:nicotinamidase-related amidase